MNRPSREIIGASAALVVGSLCGACGGSSAPAPASCSLSGAVVADSFEGDTLDLERWRVNGGKWSLQGGELVGGSGSNTPGSYDDQVHLRHEPSGPFTVEVEVRGSVPFGIVWNYRADDDKAGVWVAGNKTTFYAGGRWPAADNVGAEWRIGGTGRWKVQVSGTAATVSRDGEVLGEGTTRRSAGIVGLWAYLNETRFDNFCLAE